jgi:alpha-glucosidase
VRFNAEEEPIDTPMVDPQLLNEVFEETKDSRGIQWKCGAIYVSATGELTLTDAQQNTVLTSEPLQGGTSDVVFRSEGGQLYGRGSGPNDANILASWNNTPYPENMPFVENRENYVPHYYSTDGYVALGVVPYSIGNPSMTSPPKPNYYPANFSSNGTQITWSHTGTFELYLVPASSMDEGTSRYYELIGKPPVPPRYAFGFIASRWGWTDETYLESVLHDFRTGDYPIDAFITDFGWFTNVSDYNFVPAGEPWYHDFGYHNATFPNPKEQLRSYREDLHFRMGGIRKPRLGNTELLDYARSKNWILPGEEASDELGYAAQRNLNFSIPDVRYWYAEQQQHYLEDGVSFFWNDEGETAYFTFHWWNVAQLQSLRSVSANRRFYSINRAWQPGTARMGATVWTGDLLADWDWLVQTPGMMLNWGLAGSPYVACDIGGFWPNTTGLLLTRWYQVGVFMPTMRVHSVIDATPHFPWLWGDFAEPMRKALNLRYQLVPYHYSLAHQMYDTGKLWMRPLVAEFPLDDTAAPLTSQWLDGDLLVAPVMSNTSEYSVYLPGGTWYEFNGNATYAGPVHLGGTAEIDEIPVFVRAGSLVVLAPVVPDTASLPGGPLQLQIYGGSDANFTLVEDDGETTDSVKRSTLFTWSENQKSLTWKATGPTVPNQFTSVECVYFSAAAEQRKVPTDLNDGGSATFATQVTV